MSQLMCSARGASMSAHADRQQSRVLDSSGFFGPKSGGTPLRGWSHLIDELLRIRTLGDDWDGEGTDALDPLLVDGALSLAQYFQAEGWDPADRVLAGINGTIFFEWHGPQGYQEIEVTTPVDAELRRIPRGSSVAEVVTLCRHGS